MQEMQQLGSLRQIDKKIAASRPLDIFIFNVQKTETLTFKSHYESLQKLKELGFNINPVAVLCNDLKEVVDEIRKIGRKRDNLKFGIDGAVIKVDNLEYRAKLGVNAKTPKWAIAYKYPPETKETLLKDIETLKGILEDEAKLNRVLVRELKAIAEKYGDDRRTSIEEKQEVQI